MGELKTVSAGLQLRHALPDRRPHAPPRPRPHNERLALLPMPPAVAVSSDLSEHLWYRGPGDVATVSASQSHMLTAQGQLYQVEHAPLDPHGVHQEAASLSPAPAPSGPVAPQVQAPLPQVRIISDAERLADAMATSADLTRLWERLVAAQALEDDVLAERVGAGVDGGDGTADDVAIALSGAADGELSRTLAQGHKVRTGAAAAGADTLPLGVIGALVDDVAVNAGDNSGYEDAGEARRLMRVDSACTAASAASARGGSDNPSRVSWRVPSAISLRSEAAEDGAGTSASTTRAHARPPIPYNVVTSVRAYRDAMLQWQRVEEVALRSAGLTGVGVVAQVTDAVVAAVVSEVVAELDSAVDMVADAIVAAV